jgi:FkbM family methyltransferase
MAAFSLVRVGDRISSAMQLSGAAATILATKSSWRSMRPTARARHNGVLRTTAKLCRQYLKWFGNASYKPARNGERWLLEMLGGESIRTVVDVGANVGNWSLMAADLFPQATIYALEVVPDTAATLRANAAGQDRIQCYNLGLAAHTGTLSLRYEPTASTHATFTDYPHSWSGKRIECQVMRADDFLAQEGIGDVDFLKLDVEGAEHLVLQGLEKSLRQGRVRFVQFEYGRVNILTHFLLRDFYQLFQSYGYVVGKIYPDYVDFREYDLSDEDFLGPNYLACRAGDDTVLHLRRGATRQSSPLP